MRCARGLAVLILVVGSVPAVADPRPPAPAEPSRALGLALQLDLRLRHEAVDDPRWVEPARAQTARGSLQGRLALPAGVEAVVTGEWIRRLGPARFDDGLPGAPGMPLVADPPAEELDEAYLAWHAHAGAAEWTAWAGRRGWGQANLRFLSGGPAWRHNRQSHDGLGLQWQQATLELEGFHLETTHRPLGNRSPRGVQDLDGEGLRLRWTPAASPYAEAYAQQLRFAEGGPIPASFSHRLTGLRLGARQSLAIGQLGIELDQARQDPLAVGGLAAGDYQRLALSLQRGRWTVSLEREQLGGDGRRSLQTPLAALHAFQGHADVFLRTPPDGLIDQALGL